MTDKLLPCPFCGGQPQSVENWEWNFVRRFVYCEAYGARSPYFGNADEAITWWNTRALPPPIGADEIQSGAIGARTREVMIRQVESKMLQIPYDEGTVAFRQRRTKELAVEAVDAILALSGPLQNDT